MEFTDSLLWEEEEVFSKVEGILGVTPFKDNNNNYAYWDNGHELCLQAHIDKIGGYSISKHKWEWNREKDKMDEIVQIAVEKESKVELVRCINIIYNKNGILGADDRAGIIVILYVMNYCQENNIPLPSVLLTNHEESGGTGMKTFITQCDKKLMEKVNLIIALDRRGSVDYVYYSEPDKEVKTYIEMFGFIKAIGSYSDCKDLTDAWEIPSVNLSVGYYGAHTKGEELHLDETLLTANRVIEMIHYPIEKRYSVEKKKEYSYCSGYYGGHGDWDEYWETPQNKRKINNNVIVLGDCIPINTLDMLLTDWEIKKGWRVICDVWEHHTPERWKKMLNNPDSIEYQTESFHIFKNHKIKYILFDNKTSDNKTREFYLAVKFKNKEEYTKLTTKRWELDYGDPVSEENLSDGNLVSTEGFRTADEEAMERMLIEYKESNSPYCAAFYSGSCDGGCGGDVTYCSSIKYNAR